MRTIGIVHLQHLLIFLLETTAKAHGLLQHKTKEEIEMAFTFGLQNRISDGIAKRRVFNRTFNELSALSQRELEDLGLTRWNIEAVARDAAYRK